MDVLFECEVVDGDACARLRAVTCLIESVLCTDAVDLIQIDGSVRDIRTKLHVGRYDRGTANWRYSESWWALL